MSELQPLCTWLSPPLAPTFHYHVALLAAAVLVDCWWLVLRSGNEWAAAVLVDCWLVLRSGNEWAKLLMPVHVVNTVLKVAARSDLNLDSSRIFLTGKSMGGEGSWKVAATCPRLWAAVVPMCGGMWPYTNGMVGSGAQEYGHLVTMPVWVFHAGASP